MRIENRQMLKCVLDEERKVYFNSNKITLEQCYRSSVKYNIYKYIAILRKYEYLCERRDSAKNKIVGLYQSLRVKKADRKKNKLGLITNLEVTPGFVEKGIIICHPNVIINGYIGYNCILHGNNVIGNKRTGAKNEIPYIGNNVDIGAGAMVIGNVTIADNCIIGAGAVVTRSFLEPGSIIAGVPAKKITREYV